MDRAVRALPRAFVVLCVILVGTLAAIVGSSSSATADSGANDPPAAAVGGDPDGLRELPDLRTRRSRTFEEPDGTRVSRIYAAPVNYRAPDGSLQPIDADLEQAADGSLHTEATGYALEVPESLSDPVEVAVGSDSVSFALEGADGERSTDGAEASFDNALPGVDARYTAGPNLVKEEFELAGPDAERAFEFALDPSPGLTPKLSRLGAIDFEDAAGDLSSLSIAPPVMSDADGATSDDLAYRLRQAADGAWTLTLDADRPWLHGADRAWPMTIDPTVYTGVDQGQNNFISQASPNYTGSGNFLYAGRHPSWGVYRAMLKMSLSGIPDYAKVYEAKLHLHESGDPSNLGTGIAPIEVHGLTNSFTNAMTWNTRDGSNPWVTPGGDYSNRVEDTQTVDSACNCWYAWDVGDLVADQVAGGANGIGRQNLGILLRSTNETANGMPALDNWFTARGRRGWRSHGTRRPERRAATRSTLTGCRIA